jgi:hypothetical protein
MPELIDALWPAPLDEKAPRAFAILDAARDDAVYPAILAADCDWCCLYRGDAAVTMAEVAPYLVALDPASRFTPWLLEQGWGKAWGVFLTATVKMEALRAHFRRFIMAQLPDGRSVYFRFYDPRVLRVYLPTCTDEERKAIFGPVERYVMEGEEGEVTVFA